MTRPFLSARWKNLLNLTYEVPPELLEPHCPDSLELEREDGHSFVSVVGFDFTETCVRGIRFPGYTNFPELNLRFYVRYGGERGVVFIREFVPKRMVAWLARILYDEPYRHSRMKTSQELKDASRTWSLRIRHGGRRHKLEVTTANLSTYVPDEDSRDHFFKEHSWGFNDDGRGGTRRYRVVHPRWAVYDLDDVKVNLDFGLLYGEEWNFLNETEPTHTVFAQGSDVVVYPSENIDGADG
ncbi:MAG: DUF2071 domain-containing protein [Halobacteriales archaeon]|nr:DUF2071 domain-containing protein [Halobacteriales archaeon]